ncbi:uncharacterized protein SAPINGB_P002607 [Magnusiomyces paraingens]|uniref:Glucose-6-phosphate 1-dehydrogenase n=1 Tax=Magnusiomyces paraingens TaxID=2606893 RepID=A0A5E8BET9_9ASCO|nr:uncharacterized protein SAPINGB_P002607 [Saprochaete ingens]VVT50113.1 unnamed protein product [Saprochaete ingens]
MAAVARRRSSSVGLSPVAATELTDSVVIVVFGASGDLAKKKTFPALFGLFKNGLLPRKTKIVGYARTKMTHDEFIDRITQRLNYNKDDQTQVTKVQKFKDIVSYVSGQYDSDEGFIELNKHVVALEDEMQVETRDRFFYFALPPSVFAEVSVHLRKEVYPPGEKDSVRVIIEKPFGRDLKTSRELQDKLSQVWQENEMFRIDHYLGKEMVKNILILRFGNVFFSSSWNRNTISNVQISFKEPFGTEGRGGYFDNIGIIRDVMQNHLLQVLSLVAMERPVSFDSEDIRDEKVKVLKAIAPLDIKNCVLGQYDKSIDGTKPAYTDDETVKPGSRAVTFATIALSIENERWEGVPFILRAGKALDEAKVEIRIQFKDVPRGIFQSIPRNELVIRVQPEEAIYLKMNCKYPGLSTRTLPTDMDLTYHSRYADLRIPEAYEALILDALKGDHSNFVRDDELDVSWTLFTPLLDLIDNDESIIPEKYPYGSRGPASVSKFLSDRGYVRDTAGLYQWPVTRGNL